MLIQAPKIDKRSYEQLVSEMKALIPGLLPEWKPGEEDPGLALIKIFSHMAEEVIDRLNQVPKKYFGAFLDMLGISLLPATAARAPVTFYLSEGADSHVMIPKGTPVAAEDNDIVFETEKNIYATPAKLIKSFTMTPKENKKQTLYLGFDKQIQKGPISIYFSFETNTNEFPVLPGEKVWWYYYAGNEEWKILETIDNTKNMTESGTVESWFPPDFKEKGVAPPTYYSPLVLDVESDRDDEKASSYTLLQGTDEKVLSDEELYWIKAVGMIGQSSKIKSIHMNTTFVSQVESIEDEILGSGDGSANQEFQLLRAPVISEEIWVNETNTLTDEEKQVVLEKNGKDAVREIKDETGKTTGVQVRWQPVQDFFASSSKSRHYVIERVTGQVRFGDGIHGMVPPTGRDNINAYYWVGGGKKGNVSAFEISQLKTSIPYVDRVSNPDPAQGGSDIEQMPGVFNRGPYTIKHRNRAVTREDFERLAAAASPYIARTACLEIDNKLKIIVIPNEEKEKPFPSPALLKIVEKNLVQQSLNLVSPQNIEVCGPQYVEVGITVNIVPVSVDIAVHLESEILERIKAFLHPLTGGPEKKGWKFGRNLHISDVYALLESIEGVDHVENLLLNNKHEDVPVQPFETLCSGQHKIALF